MRISCSLAHFLFLGRDGFFLGSWSSSLATTGVGFDFSGVRTLNVICGGGFGVGHIGIERGLAEDELVGQ